MSENNIENPKQQQIQQTQQIPQQTQKKVTKQQIVDNKDQKIDFVNESLAIQQYEKTQKQIKTQKSIQVQIQKQGIKQNELKPSKQSKQSSKKVQISKKQLKQYLKFATQNQSLKKQVQSIKKEYNKVAKQLISTRQDLDKKILQIKQLQIQIKNNTQRHDKSNNEIQVLRKKHQKSLLQVQSLSKKLKQQQTKSLLQVQTLGKKLKQQQKQSQKRIGLQQTIKQLQKIVDISTKNQMVLQRQSQKYKQILRIQKQMNVNLKSQVQDLRHVSSQYFLLKQEVSRLSNQLKLYKQAKEQYQKVVQKYQNQLHLNQQLKEKIIVLEDNLMKDKMFIQKLNKKIDHNHQQILNVQRKYHAVQTQKEELEGEFQAVKMEIQDQRTEIQVLRKRYISQIKDLKLALHHQHQKLKLSQIQLQQSRANQKKPLNLQKTAISSLSKQDLLNIIQQLQTKNLSIKQNLTLLIQDLQSKSQKLKQKDLAILALSRQLIKALPNMEESQGMEYVEKEVIQMAKDNKQDYSEIVEKVMLENLRLKNSVTKLGQEYNLRARQTEKQLLANK